MKRLLFILFTFGSLNLAAQYDFPGVINGLSVGLDLRGCGEITAQQIVVNDESDCAYTGILKLARTSFQFPRDSFPPPTAGDTLKFTCNDFSSESVEVWYQDQFSRWRVADTYVVLVGADSCGCTGDSCLAAPPVLYNGYSVSYQSDGIVSIHAKELVVTVQEGFTYSFSEDPADSVRVYSCGGDIINPVLVYSHQTGYQSRAASTYVALPPDCAVLDFNGAPARIIQGLTVPNTGAEIISVPARFFAVRNVPGQQLSFSTDPADTLFSIGCNQIGDGGIPLQLYNHQSGVPGMPTFSYLVGDDVQNHCGVSNEDNAPNDASENALTLGNCRIFQQFVRASSSGEDAALPGSGGSVWYRWGTNDTLPPGIEITAVDSLYFALFTGGAPSAGGSLAASGLLVPGADTLLFDCTLPNNDNLVLQINALDTGQFCRFFLRGALSDRCVGLAPIAVPATAVRIAPNPGADLFTLSIQDQSEFSPIQLEVIRLDGQRILSQSISTNSPQIRLALENQSPGVYLVRLTGDRKFWTGRLILL